MSAGDAGKERVRDLERIILRDLGRLDREIRAYPSDDDLWRVEGAIPNSAGTLALHLAGNLRHFVGAALGGSGYVRDRDREFEVRGLGRAALLSEVEAARVEVAAALATLDAEALGRLWPGRTPLGDDATVAAMLLHLSGHLMYHVGQINYHRRLLAGEPPA